MVLSVVRSVAIQRSPSSVVEVWTRAAVLESTPPTMPLLAALVHSKMYVLQKFYFVSDSRKSETVGLVISKGPDKYMW